ncbi:MAG: hypothetical protein CSB44_01905 [Gammaproteobacteria bacterium]|nr:MAG: hypothetical protein CSB44_01905 [Gammaproteobacteria bacterium]
MVPSGVWNDVKTVRSGTKPILVHLRVLHERRITLPEPIASIEDETSIPEELLVLFRGNEVSLSALTHFDFADCIFIGESGRRFIFAIRASYHGKREPIVVE